MYICVGAPHDVCTMTKPPNDAFLVSELLRGTGPCVCSCEQRQARERPGRKEHQQAG